jgi:hypothetical protein
VRGDIVLRLKSLRSLCARYPMFMRPICYKWSTAHCLGHMNAYCLLVVFNTSWPRLSRLVPRAGTPPPHIEHRPTLVTLAKCQHPPTSTIDEARVVLQQLCCISDVLLTMLSSLVPA